MAQLLELISVKDGIIKLREDGLKISQDSNLVTREDILYNTQDGVRILLENPSFPKFWRNVLDKTLPEVFRIVNYFHQDTSVVRFLHYEKIIEKMKKDSDPEKKIDFDAVLANVLVRLTFFAIIITVSSHSFKVY